MIERAYVTINKAYWRDIGIMAKTCVLGHWLLHEEHSIPHTDFQDLLEKPTACCRSSGLHNYSMTAGVDLLQNILVYLLGLANRQALRDSTAHKTLSMHKEVSPAKLLTNPCHCQHIPMHNPVQALRLSTCRETHSIRL